MTQVIAMSRWDGVNCWLDTVDGERVDVALRCLVDGRERWRRRHQLPCRLPAPAEVFRLEWSDDLDADHWDAVLPATLRRQRTEFRVTDGSLREAGIDRMSEGLFIGRHRVTGAASAWSLIDQHEDSVLLEPSNLGPQHIARAPGDIVIDGIGIRLESVPPTDPPYSLAATDAVSPLSCVAAPLDGPITVHVRRAERHPPEP